LRLIAAQTDSSHAEMQLPENRIQIIHLRYPRTSCGIPESQNQRNPSIGRELKVGENPIPARKKGMNRSDRTTIHEEPYTSRIQTNHEIQRKLAIMVRTSKLQSAPKLQLQAATIEEKSKGAAV